MFLRTPQGDGLAVLILVRLLLHRAQHSRDTNGDQVGRIPLGYPKRCLFFFFTRFLLPLSAVGQLQSNFYAIQLLPD